MLDGVYGALIYLVKLRDRSLSLAAQALWEYMAKRSDEFVSPAEEERGSVPAPTHAKADIG